MGGGTHAHDKGRDCARTEEVLANYRTRALAAEAALTERQKVEAERDEALRLLWEVPFSALSHSVGGNYGGPVCSICKQWIEGSDGHTEDCLVTRARAFLAKHPEEPVDNGFVCNRLGGGHRLGTTTCPACRP